MHCLKGKKFPQKEMLLAGPSLDDYFFQDYLLKAKTQFENKWQTPTTPMAANKLQSFKFIKTIGKGTFYQINLVQHEATNELYTLKVQSKEKLVLMKHVDHVVNTKKTLTSSKFPFIIDLIDYGMDNSHIYFVMEYLAGGDIFRRLQKLRKFDENSCRFYASQVVLAFEYLHSMDIIYRDLKPENVLIGSDGYIKITDFSFAKKIGGKTWTICGTTEFIAPEIILCKGYTKAVDWWTLGILIYEMAAGYTPFCAETSADIFKKILSHKYSFPPYFSPGLIDLLKHLLVADPSKRYGNMENGIQDIKKHKWFDAIDWIDIFQKMVKPPYIPFPEDLYEAQNYDLYSEQPIINAVNDEFAEEFSQF